MISDFSKFFRLLRLELSFDHNVQLCIKLWLSLHQEWMTSENRHLRWELAELTAKLSDAHDAPLACCSKICCQAIWVVARKVSMWNVSFLLRFVISPVFGFCLTRGDSCAICWVFWINLQGIFLQPLLPARIPVENQLAVGVRICCKWQVIS